MIHIFNKPLGLGNVYENRKMYVGEVEYPIFNDPCLKNIPTRHLDKCLVLTNSFGNGCLGPMDVGNIGLPNVIYCEDTNAVHYYVPKGNG